MIIKCSRQEILEALGMTQIEYPGLTLNRFDSLNSRDNRYAVTLRMESSRDKGARRSHSGRRMVSACWHVHGTFMDNMPEGTEIVSLGRKCHAGVDDWYDWNAGSIMYPVYISELCDCQ